MLMLVDGNNLFMRAHFATGREHMSAAGESTAALTVFANSLSRHVRQERPDRLAVCWDGGGSDYRHRLLASYKGNRTAQVDDAVRTTRDQVREFLALAGIFQVTRQGFEADDLIGRYWYDAGQDVLVLSNDKDFLQLAGPTPQGRACTILRLSSGGVPDERWDAARVYEHTGVAPRDIPSWMALTGDQGDNVPGVPGIGPKKALALLQEAGWDLGAVEDPAVAQHRQQAALSRLLVDLRLPVPGLVLAPPPPLRPTAPYSALFGPFVQFLDHYELKQIKNRLETGTLWDTPE